MSKILDYKIIYDHEDGQIDIHITHSPNDGNDKLVLADVDPAVVDLLSNLLRHERNKFVVSGNRLVFGKLKTEKGRKEKRKR